jgi:lipopolysaccharide export system protein LptA
MANLKRFWTMSAACGLLLCGQAMAQTPAPAAPGGGFKVYDISSDNLTRIDAEHRVIYTGAVEAVIDGGKARLTCDTLTVNFYGPGEGPNAQGAGAAPAPKKTADVSSDTSGGNVKQLLAEGHAFYTTQNETARSDHMVYDAEPDIITLTGGVIVVQGKNVMRGDKMVINQKTGETDATSAATGRNNPNRVRSVIYNDNNTQNGQAAQGQASQGQSAAKPAAAPAKKP